MASILAFESFDGGSHKQFRETITRYSSHDWTWITRPPRAWKWRMTIGAQEMVDEMTRQEIRKPDCIFATSLVDVAALRSALKRGWRDLPIVLYMHENQVAYPTDDARDASFALTNLQSVLAADLTIFNSKWNLDSFIEGITSLLEHANDCALGDIEERIRGVSTVSWVPVEVPEEDSRVLHNSDMSGPTTVVWPHRWEHDKGPDELLELAREYTKALNLRWIILGEQFRETPESLVTFQSEFADQIDHCGFVNSKRDYWKWLHKADWVLSTATHEFFGIAVVEALFAGCLPWLPQRLSYKELLPASGRGLAPINPPEHPFLVKEAICKHLFMAQAEQSSKRIDGLIANIRKSG